MSRNELFLLLACAIVVSVMSGSPAPLARSSSLTIASLISPSAIDGAVNNSALYQQSFDQQ